MMASNPRENELTWSPNQIQETGTELARLYLQHVPYTHDYLVNEVVTDDFFFLNGNLTEKVYFLFSKSDQGSNYFLNSKIREQVIQELSKVHKDARLDLSRILFHGYFETYPLALKKSWVANFHKIVRDYICEIPDNRIFSHFFDKNAVQNVAHLYSGGNFADFISKVGYGIVSPESKFSSLVWDEIRKNYKQILVSNLHNQTVFNVLNDFQHFLFSSDSGRLRSISHTSELSALVVEIIKTEKQLTDKERSQVLDLLGAMEQERYVLERFDQNDFLIGKLDEAIGNIRCLLSEETPKKRKLPDVVLDEIGKLLEGGTEEEYKKYKEFPDRSHIDRTNPPIEDPSKKNSKEKDEGSKPNSDGPTQAPSAQTSANDKNKNGNGITVKKHSPKKNSYKYRLGLSIFWFFSGLVALLLLLFVSGPLFLFVF